MSNFKLGIFKDLAGYLAAANTECGSSVDKCDPDKTYSRYYLQKYYKTKQHRLRNEDVAPQFTNAVVKFAQTLSTYDKSVGASPTLKKLMRDGARNFLDKIVVGNSGKKVGELVTDLNANLTTSTASDGDNKLKDGKLKNIKNLTDQLEIVINNTSGLLPVDVANAVTCLTGTGGKKVDGKSSCESLTTLLTAKVVTSTTPYQINASKEFIDPEVTRRDEKELIIKSVLEVIDAWITVNYDTSALTVTGTNTNVANALTLLKNSTTNGELLDQIELQLFNEFFTVMKKKTDGTWESCSSGEIDLAKLAEFRINCLMTDLNNDRVPTIVSLIPLLTTNTRIGYNDGNLSILATDTDALKKVFQDAYLHPTAPKLLADFNLSSNSELKPDLELLLSEILMRKTTPDAHIDEDDTHKIAKVLSRWRRVGEDVWEHTLDDGVTVTIKPGSTEFENEVMNEVSNCPALGFSDDPVKCATFLRSVALDNTEELAKVALELNDKVAPEVVANLHPKFALAILKAFGFHRKMCKDKIAGRQIEKIQRANEWTEKFINKKFTDAQATSIKGKDKLIAFLDLLAQLVNANPSVLNDNMVTETEESRGEIVVPDELAARKIKPAKVKGSGKPFLAWGEIQSNMNKVYGSFSRGLTFDGLSTNSPFGMDNLFPQMSMLTSAPVVRGSTWGGMAGGGPSDIKVFLQDHQTGLEYSRNVQTIIDELLANLKSSGKTFDKSELDIISKKKAQFEVMERELFDIAWNIQKYSQLLKIVEAENRPEIITREHVEKYVEKYNSLVNRYEKTGSSFNTLISLLKDCTEDGSDGGKCKTL